MVKRHGKPGLRSTWVGPATIVKINGENCYTVEQENTTTREHVNNIRKATLNKPFHQKESKTQYEEGDGIPLQAIVGLPAAGEPVSPYNNQDLHRIRQRQKDRLKK